MERDLFYCADYWCDGHSTSGARCIDPLDLPDTDESDESDEETCP